VVWRFGVRASSEPCRNNNGRRGVAGRRCRARVMARWRRGGRQGRSEWPRGLTVVMWTSSWLSSLIIRRTGRSLCSSLCSQATEEGTAATAAPVALSDVGTKILRRSLRGGRAWARQIVANSLVAAAVAPPSRAPPSALVQEARAAFGEGVAGVAPLLGSSWRSPRELLPTYLLPSFLPSFLPSLLPSFLPSFLPSCLPAFLPSCLPAAFLPSCLPVSLTGSDFPFC
jgi:hypothetical protein